MSWLPLRSSSWLSWGPFGEKKKMEDADGQLIPIEADRTSTKGRGWFETPCTCLNKCSQHMGTFTLLRNNVRIVTLLSPSFKKCCIKRDGYLVIQVNPGKDMLCIDKAHLKKLKSMAHAHGQAYHGCTAGSSVHQRYQ